MNDDSLRLSGCKRVAIMGGTFDPIHYGHLVTAEAVRHVYGLQKVLFMPSGRPPHKENLSVTDYEYRYLMTLLATAGNPCFQASRFEIDKPGTSYTIDTVTALRARYPDMKLYFITGADAVEQILTWKDADKLLGLCSFVAATRPGYHRDDLTGHVKDLKAQYDSRVHLLEVPGLAISSSDIRERVCHEEPVKYLLPESVERCIMKVGLYRTGKAVLRTDLTGIVRFVRERLGERRFVHTIGTAEEAVKLAEKYGADSLKAYTAALLHDCAKEYTKEQKKTLCERYGIKPDETISRHFDLIHGYLSAEIARSDFSITDKDMLNAIRYHTTGRRAMSLLEKVIYLADGIEPNREPYLGLSEIREAAGEDLDRAVKKCLKRTIRYNRQQGRLIHPLSLEALSYYKKHRKEGKK